MRDAADLVAAVLGEPQVAVRPCRDPHWRTCRRGYGVLDHDSRAAAARGTIASAAGPAAYATEMQTVTMRPKLIGGWSITHSAQA